MLKYLIYFKLAFNDLLAYKANFIIYIVANMVFFFLYFTIWKNIYTTNGLTDIAAFTLNNTVTYYFITSFMFRLDPTNAMYLNETVWSGSFTNDLIKPWSAIIIDFVYTLNELCVRVLLYLPFAAFMFFAASGFVDLPTIPNLIYFIITCILAIFLSFFFYNIIHALCFHFGDQDANISLLSYFIAFPAGGFFPLAFLPETLRKIAYVLPFRFLFDTPANIYLGKLSQGQIFSAWGQMVLWIVVFFIIFYIVFKTGLKKYTGQEDNA